MGGTVGGISTDRSGKDFSKIEEYQDLGNGVLSNIFYRGRDDRNWVDFYGENFGRDDMYVSLRGGQYDAYKYRAYTNWLPHNLAYDARTPFFGVGSSLLTAQFPAPSPDTWNPFNLGYQRKDTGGYFEWQATSPWYVRVEGNQVKFDGTKAGSGALGTSPGNGFMDLAIPVSTTTTRRSTGPIRISAATSTRLTCRSATTSSASRPTRCGASCRWPRRSPRGIPGRGRRMTRRCH